MSYFDTFKYGFFVVVGLIVLFFFSQLIYHFSTKEVTYLKVQDKEQIFESKGKKSKSYYLIYGEREVFKNQDSWLELKFNSSDVYRKAEKGKCYKTEAWSYRIPFFSMYRKIDQLKEVSCEKAGFGETTSPSR